MIFDLMAGIVERNSGYFKETIRPLVDEAKIFLLPGRAHEFLPKEINYAVVKDVQDEFFLPFQTIAVEDTASCIILHDMIKNQKGLWAERFFCECLPLSKDTLNEFPIEPEEGDDELFSMFPEDTAILSYGSIRAIAKNEQGYEVDGKVLGSIAVSKTKGLITNAQETETFKKEISRAALRNAMTAIEEVMYFNTPNRFILENKPFKIGKRKKDKYGNNRILRSHQRSQYTLLTPKEIRKRLQISTGTGATKGPHERRRHPRTFHSDKFKNVQGKTIIIPATWIGPSEKVIKNRRYKVMLDL